MDSMAIAMIISQRAAQEAGSALPNAPIVPHVDRVPVPRTRRTVAGALRHLADVVAPPRAAGDHGQ
jgi:hypothetical protein